MFKQSSDRLFILFTVILCPVFSDHNNDTDMCTDNAEAADMSCHCGEAAIPEWTDLFYGSNNTPYNSNHSQHNSHKSRIVYKCHDKNDLLVGNDIRKCHRGKWLGQIPRCARNLLKESQLKSIDIINWSDRPNSQISFFTKYYNTIGAFTPPLNKQPAVCPSLRTDGQYLWQITLDRPVPINYLQFKFYAYNIRKYWANNNFRIRVYMMNYHNISTWINCSYNDDPIGNRSRKSYRNNNNNKNASNNNYLNLEYFCEDDRVNMTYNKINLEFETLIKSEKLARIHLCDLRVYWFDDSCGEPDYPVSVQVQRSPYEHKRYDVFCFEHDYVLEVPGMNFIKCGPNGKWLDEVPICVPSAYCRGFPNNTFTNNTNVEYERQMQHANGHHGPLFENGTTARLTCKNSAQGYFKLICEKGRWRVHESHGMTQCKPEEDRISPNQKLIRTLAMVLIVCLLVIFLLIFNRIKCRKNRHNNPLTDRSNSQPNDYDLAFYESDVKYEEISETYDKVPQIYYNCIEDMTSSQLHMNPIFRDDLSDQGNEVQKTNSIYSNLSNL